MERPRALLLGRQGGGARACARRRATVGSRASDESKAPRARTPSWSSKTSKRGIYKYNPLALWTEKDLWQRIFERDLPYNPLHDQGYSSIGCAPCTLPGMRDARAVGRQREDRVRHCTWDHAVSVAERPQLSHLRALESEAIHVMREVAAEFERPVLLFSGGKDSIVLLRLAEKAFRPGPFPFPLMHVDTGHNFPEVIEFRDRRVAELGERLIVASVQESIDTGRAVEEKGPRASRNQLQTVTLLDAIAEHKFDAAFGGARRDEERARAKERVFSFRDDFGGWDPKSQRPELWNLYNGRIKKGENVRVFPISNWTELDVWEYIDQEQLEVPSIYFAHEREVFKRDGMLYAWREDVELIDGRERLLGDGPLSHRRRHELHRRRTLSAATLQEVVTEIAATRITERGETRADDRVSRPPWRTARRPGTSSGASSGSRTREPQHDPRSAALHHRRLGRRRQEHLDRQAPVRHQAGVRGPARPRRPGFRAPWRRGGARSGAAHRRSARRARAGHHDRRGLPLLRHPQAQVHHRRLPGHQQYTRNMVTGASTADLSVILLDARKGVSEQSKRHAFISALLGIPHLVVAVNKMDLVDYSQERFDELVAEFEVFAEKLQGIGTGTGMGRDITYIPISALNGDNVVDRSDSMDWYDGPTLLELLEQVEVAYDHPYDRPARFPVQWVIRPAQGPATIAATQARSQAARSGGRGGRRAARRASAPASPRSTPTTASCGEALAPMSVT